MMNDDEWEAFQSALEKVIDKMGKEAQSVANLKKWSREMLMGCSVEQLAKFLAMSDEERASVYRELGMAIDVIFEQGPPVSYVDATVAGIKAYRPDLTEEEIRDGIEEGRDWISRSTNFGDLTSLIMVIGGAALMGLVFFPKLSGMLRWPGVALLITGVFFFVVGKIAESEVPDRLTDVIETSADKVSGVDIRWEHLSSYVL